MRGVGWGCATGWSSRQCWGCAGAVLAPVRPGPHEGGRRARLKEDDAVLVANRRDIPSDPLECERRVRLRGRVAPVDSVCGGSRLAARKPQVVRRRGRERESGAKRWRHLRAIGRSFARRGFAQRGVTLLGKSARRGFTNATIEGAALIRARAVIRVGSHCCGCCCGCSCWLISVAQESLDRCSLPVISQPRSHALQGEHSCANLQQDAV